MDWDIYEEKLDTLLDRLLISEWPEVKDLVNACMGLHEIDSPRAEDVLQQRILDVLSDFADLPNQLEDKDLDNEDLENENPCPTDVDCSDCERRHDCEFYEDPDHKEEEVDPCEDCDEDCDGCEYNEDPCDDCDLDSCEDCVLNDKNEDLDADEDAIESECASDELNTVMAMLNTTVESLKVMLPMELATRILQLLDENQQESALLTLTEVRQDMDLVRAIVENL